jgi:hypothetical protein
MMRLTLFLLVALTGAAAPAVGADESGMEDNLHDAGRGWELAAP